MRIPNYNLVREQEKDNEIVQKKKDCLQKGRVPPSINNMYILLDKYFIICQKETQIQSVGYTLLNTSGI